MLRENTTQRLMKIVYYSIDQQIDAFDKLGKFVSWFDQKACIYLLLFNTQQFYQFN